jgi:tRNA dimethylallyltransferase
LALTEAGHGGAPVMGAGIVVAGPTASGKSALALRLAEALGGVVINADSMQLYRDLPILSARPGPEEEKRVPHRLYGMLSPTELCSVGLWRDMAVEACRQAWAQGLVPVVAGGTGLYLKALTEGLSPIPDIPLAVRDQTRALFAALGNEAFHRELASVDRDMAARLHPGNSQRLMRAYEVMAATGRSLADWQQEPPKEPPPGRFHRVLLSPPRDNLYKACDLRCHVMMERGALAEVRALLAGGLPSSAPIRRVLGAAELIRHLEGEVSLEEAVAATQQATRRYAKRQFTWFRHQLDPDQTVCTQFSESLESEIIANIRHFLLTTTE